MSTNLTAIQSRSPITKSIIFDLFAIGFVYLLPALSHVGNYPLYLFEPMRIMVIIAIAHTSRRNALLIALTLPLFSFLLTSHPVFYKTIIMTAELLINVSLFYFLSKKFKNYFTAMLVSIFASKLFYYVIKFGMLKFGFAEGDLIATPLSFQLIMMVGFSFYLFTVLSRKEIVPPVPDPTKEEF